MAVQSTLASAPRREKIRVVSFSVVRMLVTVAALLWAYFALPKASAGRERFDGVALFLFALTIFVVVFVWQITRIRRSRHPGLRALEAGVVSLVVFLVVFASVYLEWDAEVAGSFSESLSHVKALYFTVTVFATVGFGDITPTTDPTRMAVSVQMLLDLVFIGAAVKFLLQVAQDAAKRRVGPAQGPDGPSIGS